MGHTGALVVLANVRALQLDCGVLEPFSAPLCDASPSTVPGAVMAYSTHDAPVVVTLP